jgi:DNA mismatch repair protein MutS2
VRRLLPHDVLEVEAGLMKLQVSRDDVIEVLPDAPPPESRLPKGVTFNAAPRGPDASGLSSFREINVIGRRAEEAVDEVGKFLDHAAMADVLRVRVVHGHGMGILKRAIAEMLAGHPQVAKFSQAPQQEGGAGATIVELKLD